MIFNTFRKFHPITEVCLILWQSGVWVSLLIRNTEMITQNTSVSMYTKESSDEV